MKYGIWLIGALGLTTSVSVQASVTTDINAALDAYQKRDYGHCVEILSSISRQSSQFSGEGELFYVECLAAADRTDEAQKVIAQQASAGRINLDDLAHKDRPGLDKLRTSDEWARVLADAQHRDAEHQGRIDQPLRKELLARGAQDQGIRLQIIDQGGGTPASKQSLPVDYDNVAWLKTVVDKKGWPGSSMVGEDASSAAFFIAQHADFDLAFQEKVLKLMQSALANHDVYTDQVAMLTDRVLRGQGKPQLYGTQFMEAKDGSLSMQPTQDPANVDARRLSVGLVSVAEYKQALTGMYHKVVR